ncbi:MAG: hypothetical protein AAF690_24545 [Acidobacteriota bacterium]
MIVGVGGLFLLEEGIDQAPRKLFFACVVLGVFLVVGFLTYQLGRVTGESIAAGIGAFVLIAIAAAFVLWVLANWGV